MSELKTSVVKSVSGEYDFRNDPAMGAVGNIRMGVYLPGLSEIKHFSAIGVSALSSAGLATISFGVLVNPSTIVANVLMTPQLFGSFVTQPLRGVDLDATPLRLVSSVPPFQGTDVEIIMSIGTAALTGGRICWTLCYTEHIIPGGAIYS